jgi:hypothetical protein
LKCIAKVSEKSLRENQNVSAQNVSRCIFLAKETRSSNDLCHKRITDPSHLGSARRKITEQNEKSVSQEQKGNSTKLSQIKSNQAESKAASVKSQPF